MIDIAILGFGVVGGGITEVIDENRALIRSRLGEDINVKYILDLREFPDSPYGDRVVHDISVIVDDPDVKIVCEAMGGSHPALEFSLAAMAAGKSVVTSNKEVVSKHGIELLACAEKNGVSYMYEAAVGGGIPLIRSLRTSLAADEISSVRGILNGTTNYILTAMDKDGTDFSDVLKEAQRLGYAEADPSADVDGIDTMRKIIILTAIATGKLVSADDVTAETMTTVSSADMDAAKRLGGKIKFIGTYKQNSDRAEIYVCPMIVDGASPLSAVDDVFNAALADAKMTGEVMYYGRGAGRYPTAAAMVSDVFMICAGRAEAEFPRVWESAEKDFAVPFDEVSFKFYMRIKNADRSGVCERASELVGDVCELSNSPDGYTEFITGSVKNSLAKRLAKELGAESTVRLL